MPVTTWPPCATGALRETLKIFGAPAGAVVAAGGAVAAAAGEADACRGRGPPGAADGPTVGAGEAAGNGGLGGTD